MILPIFLLLLQLGHCYQRGKSEGVTSHHIPTGPRVDHEITSHRAQNHSHFSIAASRASEEIIALEGEPVCHTVAARFLSNNCQILDGKDDASIFTDSGRHIRDFLESYAVSLAICDLERGNKTVPDVCSMFRESSLAQIPVHEKAHLHVTSNEIQACLSTFSTSAVVWGTYISHKQNALRFCEAALSENSRSQSLRLFQRVTQIMGSLASLFDNDWEEHFDRMVAAVQQAVSKHLHSLSLGLLQVQEGLQRTNEYVIDTLHASLSSLARSAEDVEVELQLMLHNTTALVMKNQAEVHEEYQKVVRSFSEEASSVIMAVAAEARASMSEMSKEFEATKSRMAVLERSIEGTSALVESQSFRITENNQHLFAAKQATNYINSELKSAVASASEVNNSLGTRFFESPVWSLGMCSIVSLLLGSYGLPPSLVRNGGLVAFGASVSIIFHAMTSADFAQYPLDITHLFRKSMQPDERTSNETAAWKRNEMLANVAAS